MRIIQALEGSAWSGGQHQAFLLCRGLIQRGHEVLLICQEGSDLSRKAEKAGIRTVPHDFGKEISPLSLLHLRRHFREFRPDIVNVHRAWAHTQWLLVSLFERFRGLVVTRRVLFRPDFNPLSKVKYRSRAVRGFIAVSSAVALRLEEIGVPRDRISVVHSATDSETFDPGQSFSLEKPLPFPDQLPFCLLIANYHQNKGHHVVVDAFEKACPSMPDLQLVIAGKGTDQGRLAQRVSSSQARSRIHLLGFREDPAALFARARFSFNASFEEGFSGTVRESLLMGVPVIASDIPANREVSKLVPMRLFPPGDSQALSEAVLRASEPTLPIEGTRLRNLALEHFSIGKMIDATLSAYSHYLGKFA